VGIRCADHATPSIRKKLALTSPIRGGRSVAIVRLRTKATEFLFFCSGQLGRSVRRWEDVIKIHLKEIQFEEINWIHVTYDRDQRHAFVNTVINIHVT
jgi:hypothetical protein